MNISHATQTCDLVAEQAESYFDGTLDDASVCSLDAHLAECGSCREQMQSYREVNGLMEYSQIKAVGETREPSIESAFAPAPASLRERLAVSLGTAPWWMVSAALHILIIALAGLITMAVEMPKNEDAVIMVTELQSRPVINTEEKEQAKPDATDILRQQDVKPTDPTSQKNSDVVVPPDLLAKAELGDHFETINPDRPDTHSAYGTEDAQSFHSVTGSAEAAGGGGTGGLGMEDVIGFGGAASKGSGGGFGGGNGTGIGVQNGAGKGTFGNRSGGGRRLMVEKHGGSKATEGAVDKGLDWLARNQEGDGHWDAAKYGSAPKGGATVENLDIACTGLALLSFVGAGHTEKVGKYKENVQKAVKWLIGKQQADGRLTDFGYSHAIAGMALCEAYGMARVPETKAAAQGCINYSILMQQGEGSEKFGWTYTKNNNGPDMSNSGWHIMLLKAGKVAGLHVDTLALQGAVSFLDACQVKDAGDTYGHRYQYYPVKMGFPGVTTQRTAIAALCRLYTGTPVHEFEDCAKWLMSQPGDMPNVSKANKDADWSVNLYGWYYKTLVLFQVGGESWKTWNEKLKEAILMRECVGGANDGSWNPQGEGSKEWGRVGQTALSILCMEVYYRYHQIADGGKK